MYFKEKIIIKDEHLDEIPNIRKRYHDAYLSTKAMDDDDRNITSNAIRNLYSSSKLRPPARIVYSTSPLTAQILTILPLVQTYLAHEKRSRLSKFLHLKGIAQYFSSNSEILPDVHVSSDDLYEVLKESTEKYFPDLNFMEDAFYNAFSYVNAKNADATFKWHPICSSDYRQVSLYASQTKPIRKAILDPTNMIKQDGNFISKSEKLVSYCGLDYFYGIKRLFGSYIELTHVCSMIRYHFGIMPKLEALQKWAKLIFKKYPLDTFTFLYDNIGFASQNDGYYIEEETVIAFFKLLAPQYTEAFSFWETAAMHSSLRFVTNQMCSISDRPERIVREANGRLHCTTGPAVKWRDGVSMYCLHGVQVKDWIVEHPERLKIQDIYAERNVEIRRVLMELYGIERFLNEINAKVLNDSEFGTLYRSNPLPEEDEPFVMVKVVNSTPEPDGTKKNYFLRVPPWSLTAQEAVASTFGQNKENYQPDEET